MKLIFCLWIFAFGWCFVGGQDCYYQGCSCSDNNIWCMNLGLTRIPPLVKPRAIDVLNFDWNSIDELPAKSLPPNIHQLSIKYNPLNHIADSAFDDSINTMEALDFSSSNFTRVPNAVGRLLKLQAFHIYNATIVDWNQEALINISALVNSLILEACRMRSWPSWMSHFNNLTEISFADNFIPLIPDDGLDAVANTLTSLDIQNNSLTTVSKTFLKLKALQTLNLQHNQISNITYLPPSSKLVSLSINFNKIFDDAQVSKALLPYAASLQQLDINSNRFVSLPNISYLTGLTRLEFSNNRISDPYSGAIPNTVNAMFLDYNNLRAIPKVLMSLPRATDLVINNNALTQIQSLDFPPWIVGGELAYNFISEVTDNSFPQNSSLIFINLNNNPLTAISRQAFRNTPKLSFVNLRSTKLTRVPLGLLSGVGLTGADFTACDSLICTCQEKELMSWMKTLDVYAIAGNCGRISVYYFFTQLAADCPNVEEK